MPLVSNIQFLCEEIGISIPKLERTLGFGKGSVYKWDKNSPSIDKLEKVANYLKVSVDYLLDRGDVFDLGPYIQEEREFQGLTVKELSDHKYLQAISTQFIELEGQYLRRIPLIGRAAAGDPMTAIENPGEYIVFDTRINKVNGNQIDEFYALEVVGQSMEPTLFDGEIVLVRKQSIIDSGEIGVFRCNQDEATIKRFTREGGKVYLIPDNKQFPVQAYYDECVCVGKVIESIRRKIK